MANISKICPICGQEFTAKNGNTKYCSNQCRVEGARLARKKWEDRTGYKEARREQMRAYRAGEAVKRAKKREAEDRKRRKEAERKHAQAKALYRERLQEKAAAGDPHARMFLHNKLEVEYWQAYKDYELAFTGGYSSRTVNGVSVYDANFAEEVVETIKNTGVIIAQS